MGDFYTADQGEEETLTSFATRIEGILSQVRDKFPNQIPLFKEQKQPLLLPQFLEVLGVQKENPLKDMARSILLEH